jgi:uncharacterized protein
MKAENPALAGANNGSLWRLCAVTFAGMRISRAFIGSLLMCMTGLALAEDIVPYPQPKYRIEVERSIMVPMRDGVRLATDLYKPVGAGKRRPVILIRTQYNKADYFESDDIRDRASQFFAGQGYVVAVQDIRGRFESEGEYRLAKNDREDGHDSIEWLARQPWSTGKVGTYGCSSAGNTQVFAAQALPRHLAAMVPQHSGGASYRQRWDVASDGVLEMGWALEWFRVDGNYVKGPRAERIDYLPILKTLPVLTMDEKAGNLPNDWRNYATHPPGDPWWDQFPYFRDESRIDAPALFVNSWHDMSPGETLYMHQRFKSNGVSKRARDSQYVVIGATDHCHVDIGTKAYTFGGRDLGDVRIDLWSLYLKWFERWLLDKPDALEGVPKFQYYLMGKNEWRSAEAFPLPRTTFTKYFLGGSSANTRYGKGTLHGAAGAAGRDEYVYDPERPVPTRGMNDPAYGSFDQRDIEMRNDVLVYAGPVLERGVEVTGPIEARLYVSSSARDTDFIVKLIDVYPDGRAFEVRSGIARARYREGYAKPVLMKEGEIYEVRVDLQATGNYFGPGHRIRVDVTSSSFPRYAGNLNTGGNNFDETEGVIARNTIHHGGSHASHIVLPVIPE